MFGLQSTVFFFLLFTRLKQGSNCLSRVKLYENDLKENKNYYDQRKVQKVTWNYTWNLTLRRWMNWRGFELPRVKWIKQMYKGNPGENDFGLSWREVWAYERSSLQYIGSSDFYDLFPFLVEGGLPTNVFTWQKIKLNWNTNHYPVFSLWP